MPVGLVLRVDAKFAHVDVDGTVHLLPLRGRLFEEPGHEKRPIAPGDRVEVTLAEGGGAIDAVLPRTNRLGRRAAGEDGREQVLAANLSLVLIVMPVREPTFDPLLVDRILAATEREGIEAALVISKIDRAPPAQTEKWAELYRSLGYPVYPTSVAPGHRTDATLEELRARLHAGVTVLCGPSGAGKSSLVNAIVPGVNLRVGSLGKLRQGKHTTTHTQLVPLPGGGYVIDTPGVRAFTLYGAGTQELGFYFRDIKQLAPQCAFRNCTHRDEPDCAVRDRIAESRMRSYRLMFDELANAER